jgi:hypothetical protein
MIDLAHRNDDIFNFHLRRYQDTLIKKENDRLQHRLDMFDAIARQNKRHEDETHAKHLRNIEFGKLLTIQKAEDKRR